VEVNEVLTRDSFDGSLRRLLRREVLSAVEEAAPLARLDAGRVVVAPLHRLKNLALGELQPVLLKDGRAQHVRVERESLVNVLGEEVEVGAPLRRADAGRKLRGEEVGRLVELLGRHLLCAARAHLAPDERGQPFFTRRVEV
jgi:hypothetical protein